MRSPRWAADPKCLGFEGGRWVVLRGRLEVLGGTGGYWGALR